MLVKLVPSCESILDDLIDEIDNAGAALLAEQDCTPKRGRICGFRDFNIAVAMSCGNAKRRLSELYGLRAKEPTP